MSFGLCLVGYIVLITGLAIGAHLLHVPPKWIGVGVLCMAGLAIIHGVTATWKRLLRRHWRPSVPPGARFTEVTVRPDREGSRFEIRLPSGIAVWLTGESRVQDTVAVPTGLTAR